MKNSQNTIALVQDYCKIGILRMIGTHQLVIKDLNRVRHVFIAFSRFKTFLFFGHSKIKVRSCVLCVYAGTPLLKLKPQGHFNLSILLTRYVGYIHFILLLSLFFFLLSNLSQILDVAFLLPVSTILSCAD